jgi:pyridoxamine 5'-phosphate oxidase
MNSAFEELFAESWENIIAVKGEAKSPPTITVCNNAPEYINTYTVVLREASRDNNSLVFYTDLRSQKVDEIKQDNRITIIKYNEEGRVQVILRGTADVYHQNAITQHYWNKDGYKGRRSYLAKPAPSSVINEPKDGLEYLNGKEFNETDMEGYENFTVVKVQILALEFLKLNREGNRRVSFNLNSNNKWQGQWLVP